MTGDKRAVAETTQGDVYSLQDMVYKGLISEQRGNSYVREGADYISEELLNAVREDIEPVQCLAELNSDDIRGVTSERLNVLGKYLATRDTQFVSTPQYAEALAERIHTEDMEETADLRSDLEDAGLVTEEEGKASTVWARAHDTLWGNRSHEYKEGSKAFVVFAGSLTAIWALHELFDKDSPQYDCRPTYTEPGEGADMAEFFVGTPNATYSWQISRDSGVGSIGGVEVGSIERGVSGNETVLDITDLPEGTWDIAAIVDYGNETTGIGGTLTKCADGSTRVDYKPFTQAQSEGFKGYFGGLSERDAQTGVSQEALLRNNEAQRTPEGKITAADNRQYFGGVVSGGYEHSEENTHETMTESMVQKQAPEPTERTKQAEEDSFRRRG